MGPLDRSAMRLLIPAVVVLLVWLAPFSVEAQSDIPPLPDRNPLRTGAPAEVEAPPLKPGEYPRCPGPMQK